MVLLPLMIGWFSLNVPSGLSLYYLSNTVLTAAVMIYLKKLGGATVRVCARALAGRAGVQGAEKGGSGGVQ